MNKQNLNTLLDRADKTINESIQYLVSNGEQYDLAEWVTIKEYCKRFDVESTNVISNWIKRGVIPAESVITISQLNDLRLIKAIPYK